MKCEEIKAAFIVIKNELIQYIFGSIPSKRSHLSLSVPALSPSLHTPVEFQSLPMLKEEEKAVVVTLTSPLSLEGDEESNYRTPNIIQRILSLLGSVRPGSDLTRLQLPPQFNIPKSQLQCYGESTYCITSKSNLLSKCARGETPLDRFVSVVAWSISTLRPLPFGVAPYNPVLGETHHVSRGSLHVLLEQVSHHPPVAALHAIDDKDNIEILWCPSPIPRFHGSHIETEVKGERQLRLQEKNETYTMNSPNLVIRFFPLPTVQWLGVSTIRCLQTDLQAELSFRANPFWPSQTSIKGKIVKSSTSKIIYEITGHWDRSVVVKDVSTGKTTTIYDAKEALSGLKTPVVKDPKMVSRSESCVVWSDVSRAILEKRWENAREGKSCIEERQRKSAREREMKGEEWEPKYFKVFHSKESGWSCVPKNNSIPPAPIVVNDF